MIHHPYDEHEATRAGYGRGTVSQRGLASPPSFYAAPLPSTPSMTDAHHHYHHHHHHHPGHTQQAPPGAYYPAAPHPYLAHYPPPPPPALAAQDVHDGRVAKYEREFSGEHAPFRSYDYPRHYSYSHAPLSTPTYAPADYHNSAFAPQQQAASMADKGVHGSRPVKISAPGLRQSVSDGRSLALGDQQPTYVGHIKSSNDAILLLSACDLPAPGSPSPLLLAHDHALPPPRRVTRRLLDAERADLVASGSVFVWDEKEAGMKRWTDGRVWSASRVSGCFLTYRELEARKKMSTAASSMADGPTSNQYKPDGLIKQSFSITTTSGRKMHVISYFTKRDIREGRLRRVSEDPRFVGEGGGEWGLQVNEREYSFPEVSPMSRLQGQGEGGTNGDVSRSSKLAEEDGSDLSEMSDARSPLPARREAVQAKFDGETASLAAAATRKRLLPDSEDAAQQPARPRLARLRSSSMSGIASVSLREANPSLESSTSLDTTVASESDSARAKKPTFSRLYATANQERSSAIRALVSPTLPRESALRESACEMKPTQSQDCANAVGALLSLAGSNEDARTAASSSSPHAFPSTPNSPSSSSAVGLGLNVKGLPKRRDSDRAALSKFNVRL